MIEGGVVFENATSGGFAFGVSVPALAAGGSYIEMFVAATVGQTTGGAAATYGLGRVALSAVAASQTIVTSVSATTINTVKFMKFNGFLNVSANGSFQIMGKTSVAGASMSVRSGWIRAFKIG